MDISALISPYNDRSRDNDRSCPCMRRGHYDTEKLVETDNFNMSTHYRVFD